MMEGQPIFSVIMPMYNMAEYLEQSISSWVSQTFSEIEIICIDDASTDNSLEILKEWAQKDSRIQVHCFSENKSAWSARKLGIEKATGRYIMFADADDTLLPNACEELFHEAENAQVDILHFDAEIINVNGLPQARIHSMERFVKPYDGILEGEDVFTACFREKKYNFSLWNKVFKAEVCKQAVAEMEYAVLPKAQDKLLYFVLAYTAKSYKGLVDKKYYQYFFGRGGTGFDSLTVQQFERYCTTAWVADKIDAFLQEKGTYETYRDIAEKNRNDLLNDCMARWLNEIDLQDKATCFDLMIRHWKPFEVIGKLAQKKFYDRHTIAKQIKGAQTLLYDKREVKTIAAYYHSCCNGGAQRVFCILASLWAEMGYNVILMTDEEPSPDDYQVSESVKRIVIPHFKKMNPNNYADRAQAIHTIITENHVDLVVYHAWVCNLLLWDELVCKVSGAAFITHCHNIFSLGILNTWDSYRNTVAPYSLADGVVCLSDADRKFWQNTNNNVFEVINPFTDNINDWHVTSGDNHDILWVGRLSDEKRPYDTLYILKRVLKKIPDATLHIVGDGNNPNYVKGLKKRMADLDLQGRVLLHGFQKDVKPFYNRASVFLATSAYEGYLLTLQESKMAGLPCVMYELPYLTLCRKNRGMISVEQQNCDEAAKAIIRLFEDKEEWTRYSKDARSHIEELFDYDFKGKWKTIIESVSHEHEQAVSDGEKIMMETLLYHHDIGQKKQIEKIKKAREEGEKKNKYGKIVRYAMLVEKGLHSLKEKGIKVTLAKTINKVRKHYTKKK